MEMAGGTRKIRKRRREEEGMKTTWKVLHRSATVWWLGGGPGTGGAEKERLRVERKKRVFGGIVGGMVHRAGG